MSASQPAEMNRALGPVEATSIVVGGIIGSGIFISPAIVAREVGTPGLSLLVWIVGGILATCGGLCYAELAAAMPETGGTYVFLKRAYAPIIAFLFGWAMFFASFTGAIAAVATTFAEYAGFFLERVVPYGVGAKRGVAVALISTLTAANYVSVRLGGKIQNAATLLKVAALVAVIGTGLLFGARDADRFFPILPSDHPRGANLISAFGTALIPALFAYNGWTYSTYVAGEIRNPSRTLPLSILVGLAIVLVVYLLANIAYICVLPFDKLQSTTRPAADTMEAVLGPIGGGAAALTVMISTFGAANAVLLSCARTYYAMGRDQLFFRRFADVHPRYRTPANAILVQGILAIAFAVSGSFERILTLYTFADYAFFVLAIGAVLILRRTAPALPRPYRAWGYPITPILFIGVILWYLANTLLHRPVETAVGIVLTLSGIPFYLYWSRRKRSADSSAPVQ